MKRKITYLVALLLCFIGFTGYATTYYYVSGTFTTAGSWNTNPAGGGTAATVFTNSADIWVIRTALTLNAAWTVAGQLKIGDGSTTNTVTVSTNPTITGGITVRSGATLLQNVASTATNPNMATTQDATSTVNYASTTAHTIPAITFGNLTFSSSSASGVFSAGTTTVAGDFSQTAGTVTLGNTAAASYTVNVSGNFSISGSGAMVMASNASASTTINVTGTTTLNSTAATILNFQSGTATTGVSVFQTNGNVTISGAGTNLIDWGKGAITTNMFGVKGNLTISGTKLINTSSTTTAALGFVFNGTGAVQTVSNTSTGAAASTECSYQVNSGAYVQLAANLSLGTGTTIHSDFTVLSGGTLDCSTFVTSGGSTGGGGVQISSGARLVTANTGGVNSSVTATGSAFNGGANYEFNGSSAQVTGTSMPAAIVSPGSVSINNSAGVTLSQATSFATGDTLNLENGTFTNGTNLTMSSGSYLARDNGTLSASPSTYSGVNLVYASLGNNALTITAGNEFPASFTGNVIVNKTGATITLNNAKAITGDVTLTAGILDASTSNYNLSLTGNWANNSGTTALTARTGTVTLNGSSAQSIGGSAATSFNNLTNSNTSAAVSVNTNTNISGILNMNGAGTVLTPGATVIFNSAAAAGTVSGSGTIQVTRIAATADYVNQYKFSTNTLTGMTVEYAGAGAQTINSTVGNYGALKTSGSGTKTLTGAVVVNSDVTIGSSTTVDVSSSNYQMTVGGDWNNNGTFTAQAGTVLFNATTTGNLLTGTMTGTSKFNVLTFNGTGGAWSFGANAADVGSNFTITAGTVTAPSSTLQVTGSWSNSGTFTHNSGAVTLNGSSAQSIGGSSATSFNNLTNSNTTAAVSVNTNANIAGTLNMNGAATVLTPGATIVLNSGGAAGTISGSGTLQVTRIAATADYVNQYKFSTNTLTGMTVDYAGAGAQTINSTVGNYGTLKTSGSGTKTLAGAIVVNNDLTIGSSTVIDVSSSNYQMTVGGSWANNGTFTAQSGTVLFNATATGKTLTGTMTGTSKFNILTFNGSGGAWSFGANSADVGGNFTITAGTVTAPSSTLQVAGNWSNSGTFTSNSGTVVMNATSTGKTLSGSMTGANKFYALTFNGSGGAWSFGANSADVGNNFTVTAGTVTAPSSTLQVAGNWSNSGTFTHNNGLVTFNKTGTQTIGGSSVTAFNSITISSASVTTISTSGHTVKGILQCNDTLNAGGNLTLLSTSSQTALIDGAGSGKVLGNITMQRYLDSTFGYRYISSPFQAATLNQLSSYINLSATFPNFYGYNENVNYAGWVIDTAIADTIKPMRGYTANFGTSYSNSTFSLTGTVNNGTLSSTLYNHNNTYTLGFNLVGNPYPSPIDWTASSGWTKTNIDNAVYYFNHGDTNRYYGRYSSYISGVSSDGIANNIIPAMQGFFVHVSNGSYPVTGTLTFTNAVRTTGLNPHYFKQSASGSRPLVRLDAAIVADGRHSDPAVVYFDDQATINFDKELDAIKLMNTDASVPSLYSMAADENIYSIQSLPTLTDTMVIVPLGLKTESDGLVTFNMRDIDNLPASMHVWFYDAKTRNVQDLRTSPKYQVQLSSGKYEYRFFLQLSTHEFADIQGVNGELNAYTSGGNLYVYAATGEGDVFVTNMAGQTVARQMLNGIGYHEVKLELASGVYIATVYSKLGKQSKKIFIGND